ncbi:hypothetical protein [Saccharothrix texasensis]|uniref:Uncharacterized protein n=1 Tax=Saccharothrix texasensis TaxID=103734 RepID=A0A3N1H4W3_9PSEU|nr:hypothetical protein [Saccharothrix texasensis]ROP37564.1 hypothetical protein EDD40_2881 [Saccharothrix texasensis]
MSSRTTSVWVESADKTGQAKAMDTYRISIDDRSGATLRGRVHIINPDAEAVPPGRDFALRVIVEVWHRIRHGHFFTSGEENLPDDRLHLGLDELRGVVEEPGLKSVFERLRALDRGRDARAFHERACEVVVDYRLGEIRNWPPPWDFGDEDDEEYDEDAYAGKLAAMTLEDYPYAEFTITVGDVRHVAHIGGGIHFATAIQGGFDRE